MITHDDVDLGSLWACRKTGELHIITRSEYRRTLNGRKHDITLIFIQDFNDRVVGTLEFLDMFDKAYERIA